MRAASLVGVLLLAKALAIAGRDLPVSWLTPIALAWHDVAVGLAFWIIDAALRRPRVMWVLYGAIAAYAAINVPVTRALSSPLTVPMWKAAGGALLDSITHYVTPWNVFAMALVAGSAAGLPALLARIPQPIRRFSAAAALGVLVAGPFAASRVDTQGLHRNAVTAVVMTMSPRVTARAEDADWRTSPVASGAGEDLSRHRGAAKGRNVVLVVLESTAARYLSMHGAADDPMPNLTRLARGAIVFEHAYAVYPESIKGLFATLCSRAPAFDVSAESHAEAPCDPLTRRLSAAGYRTALFHSGRFAYLGMREVVRQQSFDLAEDAGAIGGNYQSSFGVDEPATVRRMLGWIDGLPAGQPFFITYLPIAGHHPYAVPEPGPFPDSGDLSAYKNALHYSDRALGALLDGLQSRGLDRRTLFVVFGDHGEAFGQHAGNYGHSIFIYEENVRVPFVVAMPGAESPLRVQRVASIIDTAPTILDLVGLAPSPHHEGRSLLEARQRMALFYTDYAQGWIGLRDGCWKALFEMEPRRMRLYDLCRDPGETVDRTTEDPRRTEIYRDHLERWIASQRDAILNRREVRTPR